MFEVNFFEKKQKNFLPYLISSIFLVLLLAVGIYFMLTYSHYQRQDKSNNNWLVEKQEAVALAQEMQEIVQLTNHVSLSQKMLQEEQYPMTEMTEDLISLVPNEEGTVRVFESSESNRVTFILENLTIDRISETFDAIKEQPYVDSVQMHRLENQHTPLETYLVEFAIMIDEATLKEVLQ